LTTAALAEGNLNYISSEHLVVELYVAILYMLICISLLFPLNYLYTMYLLCWGIFESYACWHVKW